jgi:hypothetical protein
MTNEQWHPPHPNAIWVDENNGIKHWSIVYFIIDELAPKLSKALAAPNPQTVGDCECSFKRLQKQLNAAQELLDFLSQFTVLLWEAKRGRDGVDGSRNANLQDQLENILQEKNEDNPEYPQLQDMVIVWGDEEDEARGSYKERLLQLKAAFADHSLEQLLRQQHWLADEVNYVRLTLMCWLCKLRVLEMYQMRMRELEQLDRKWHRDERLQMFPKWLICRTKGLQPGQKAIISDEGEIMGFVPMAPR